LHETHGEVVSATTWFWNAIDAFQNHRLASYLPGSGVIHGTWPDQGGPLGTLSQRSLGFSTNLPLVTQEDPAPTNAYSSLVMQFAHTRHSHLMVYTLSFSIQTFSWNGFLRRVEQ
jgi:hypothetical protein